MTHARKRRISGASVPIGLVLLVLMATPVPLCAAPAGARASQDATARDMTNADVIEMARAGLSDAVIVEAIHDAARVHFDTAANALVLLKKDGVGNTVIAAMLEAEARANSGPGAAGPAAAASGSRARRPDRAASSPPPAALSGRAPGIYLAKSGDPHRLVPLEPTVFSQAKTGGLFASAITYGLYKAKWKAVVHGAHAQIQTTQERPVFYFYFGRPQTGAGNAGAFSNWLSSATSPDEFVLAQMTVKRTSRELIIGQFGAFGSSTGIRSRDTVDVHVVRVAPGVYRVTPTEDLGTGEFCFYYAAGAPTPGAGATGRLFDFGDDPAAQH